MSWNIVTVTEGVLNAIGAAAAATHTKPAHRVWTARRCSSSSSKPVTNDHDAGEIQFRTRSPTRPLCRRMLLFRVQSQQRHGRTAHRIISLVRSGLDTINRQCPAGSTPAVGLWSGMWGGVP